jgi:hypothetical protein
MVFLGEGKAVARAALGRPRLVFALSAVVFLTAVVGSSQASHLFSDLAGHTTLERTVVAGNPTTGYQELGSAAVNRSYVVRDGAGESNSGIPNAQAGREQRRRSMAYFGQLTDFQLADEESPARVEFAEAQPSGFGYSAWRPQEALAPFIIDWSIRQMNLFAGESPVTQGDGSRAAMDFALMTGDQADNMQRNEMLWVRQLLEGASLDPNSGSTNPADWTSPSCNAYPPNAANLQEATKYTGVQDYDDYNGVGSPNTFFYDPDQPAGNWAVNGFPTWPGLMDRAQLPFQPVGLDVPSYVTNGNHDGLVQGNEDANAAFEDIALSCFKMLGSTVFGGGLPDPNLLLTPASAFMLVPPDPARRFVDKRQIKQIYGENNQDDAHGYDFVDPVENTLSAGFASYYAWDPPEAPGFRFISIDTLAEGGVVAVTDRGNIDDPQFQWLEGQLQAATADDKLVVIFGHHPVRSMDADVPDEAPGPCLPPDHTHGDTPEHNHNPGCDGDPRVSEPLHFGQDPQQGDPRESFVELLDRFPHVLAYVAGHTHENRVNPFVRSNNNGPWWGIETSATADWPVQHRLLEVMDNDDGTLSIFGTVLDAAAGTATPPSGSAAAGFSEAQLASINRTLAYNDPQAGPAGGAEGTARDRNVELLVDDPRTTYGHPASASPIVTSLVPTFQQCGTGSNPADGQHSPPLSSPACLPPDPTSTQAAVGPDSAGTATITVAPDLQLTPADETDFNFQLNYTDVRGGSPSGPDYAADVTSKFRLRITDTRNCGPAGCTGPYDSEGTTSDLDFSIPIDCATVPGPSGATCDANTSANAVVPGSVAGGNYSVVQVFRVRLNDAGTNGIAGDGDDALFAQQGVYIP